MVRLAPQGRGDDAGGRTALQGAWQARGERALRERHGRSPAARAPRSSRAHGAGGAGRILRTEVAVERGRADYRLAIELVDDEKIKRSWWFNLADIELQLQDETQWQSALRAALAASPADEISRRATEAQRLNSRRDRRPGDERQGQLTGEITHDVCDAMPINEPGRTADISSISDRRDGPGLRATFDIQRRREGRTVMVVKPKGLDPLSIGNQASPSLLQWICRDITDPEKRLYWAGVVVCIGLFTRLFWNNLEHFYYAWTADENYSHGFLVPLISLYFADQVARGGPGAGPQGRAMAGQSAPPCLCPRWRDWSRSRCRSPFLAISPS